MLNEQDLTELLELVAVARGEEVGRMMVAGTDMGSPTTRLVNLTGLEYKLIVMKAGNAKSDGYDEARMLDGRQPPSMGDTQEDEAY